MTSHPFYVEWSHGLTLSLSLNKYVNWNLTSLLRHLYLQCGIFSFNQQGVVIK